MAKLLVRSQTDFTLVNNTAIKRLNSSTLNSLTIEIGDSKQLDFKPQIKLLRWDNETNFSVRAEEHIEATAELLGGKFIYKTPTYEVHQYELQNGFEFEWVLPSPPKTNILTATIQHKGLDFFYQPALTQAEIRAGFVRPDNVAGSYAVYHATKGIVNKLGEYEYKTGKVAHIYRPEAIDAGGARVWCEISITNGILTVTIPQNFLDGAVYPVVVDPTFGWTSIGASTVTVENNLGMGRFAISENGTGSSVTAFLNVTTSAKNMKCNVYQDETGELDVAVAALTDGQTEQKSISTGASQQITFNFTSSPSFVSGTTYRPAIWSASDTGVGEVYYDGSIVGASGYTRALTYGTWPDPSGTLTRTDDARLSVYVTYTTSGTTAIKDMVGEDIIPRAR